MNTFAKVFIGFLLAIIALSILGFVLNVAVSLVVFALKAFILFSIGFFIYAFFQKLSRDKDKTME